jgi:hypothetical protein
VHGAHLFILPIDTQAGLGQAAVVGRNGANFSQCSTAFHGLEVQDVTEFDSG